MFHPNSCDNCKHYCWYWNICDKWDCEVDCRSVQDCFEPYRKENESEDT